MFWDFMLLVFTHSIMAIIGIKVGTSARTEKCESCGFIRDKNVERSEN